MIRVTIATPVAMIPAANELAACIGFSEADRRTFTGPTHEDADGQFYCVASGPVVEQFVQDAVSPLTEPEWGADMDAANEAQAAVAIWTEDAPVLAAPEVLAVCIGMEAGDAAAALGLTSI